MPRQKGTPKLSNEITAQYMTAELNSLTQRSLQQETALANKINFFLLMVTAVGGGLILASGIAVLQNIILPLSTLVALIFHVMGWITLSQGLDFQAGSIVFYRRMGRIRQWFMDADPSLKPYMPFEPGDNRPLFYVAYAPIRNAESILLLMNSITAGVLVSLVWLFTVYQILPWKFTSVSDPLWISLGAGCLVAVMLWFIQLRYIRRFMMEREQWEVDHGRVHFSSD
jgi:hypothetical protein